MESMRRGEANHSHHPNKVAINNLATDSNKQANTSSVSGSTLNNNKISFNNQQQTTLSSESKESNFEYDDNEWNVGGIGDLIIDLDNDIKQSSGSSVQQISSDISSSSSSIASLSSPSNSSITNQSSNTHQKPIQPKVSSSTTNVLNSLVASRPNKTAFASVAPKQQLPTNTSSSVISSKTQLSSSKQSQPSQQPQQQPPSPTTPTNVPQSALIAQLNSNRQVGFVEANQKLIPENMSSTPSGQGAGKAGTKISIDHQSLKMKIKRTKPGTKTSEAKHEIVKADMQNGAISGADDSSSSTSSSGKSQRTPLPSSPAILPASATTAASSANSTPQTTKRGLSGHRRDKTKEKTSHSQRDKNDQLSQQQQQQQPQSHNNSSSQNNDRTCTCSHDGQVNGSTQTPCSNGSCIRNRTMDTTNMPLVQRISSNSQSNSNSTNNSVSTPLAAGVIPTGIFAASSIASGGVQLPTSGTTNANAPGPPKDAKIASNLLHTTPVQLPTSIPPISNIQQQSSASTTAPTSSSSSTTTTVTSSALMKSSSTSSSSIAPSSVNSSSNSSSSSSASNCEESTSPPPSKKIKFEPKEMVDVCVGTSVGTITEPDCLGPCEPGTSVTLEGIVWHETEGGVLVVNVTWRGKTYVGTLMDCTRHEWAPPRFCDSPTEELDSRTPKGRGKRGRSAAQQPSNDLSNFTETRSSVHSKLRNGGAKGRGGRTSTTTGTPTSTTNTTTTTTATTTSTSTNSSSSNSGSNTSSNTPSTSPTSFLPPRPEKRKSKDESPPPPVNGDSETKSLINPLTGLNVQIPAKKVKTTAPCAISPVLLECPEQDCSKKYKHANGLKYHQSHAHGAGSMDEDSQQPESPRAVPPTTPSPAPATPQPVSQTSQALSSSPPSTPLSNSNSSSAIAQTLTTQEPPSTPTPSSPLPASTTPSIPIATTVSNTPTTTGLLTPVTLTPGTTQPQLLSHPFAGGSITTGVAGPALQQQQPPTLAANPSLSDSNLSPIPASPQQQQQQPLISSGIVQTPTRSDVQGKIKTGVLRFGPAPEELNRLSNSSGVTTPTALSQSPLRPAPLSSMTRMAGSTTPESSLQPSDYSTASQSNVSSIPIVGSKSQKKRKEGSGIDYESTSSNRDDVQSPAYSDISDDSTPVVDTDVMDKTQASKHPESVKKITDGPPAQIGPLSGFNMYPFYPQQPYLPPDHHGINKPPSVQSSLNPSAVQDYNKVKEPPLDLMTKPSSNSQDPLALSKENTSASPQAPPSKFMGNYYPYNYIPPGYPSYNLDPNYGAVSMVSDDSKLSNQQQQQQQQQQPSSLKEERLKENPSPSEHPKMQPQLMPTKLIKTEPPVTKDSKQDPVGHPMHQQKDHGHSMGPYPMYARHGINVPPPQQPQHMSREEELRRYYMTYPDQRRSSTSSNSSSTNMQSTHIKEEPPSPSPQSLQNPPTPDSRQSSQMGQVPPSPQQQQQQQQQMTQQQQSQQQLSQQQQHRSSSQKSSSQKSSSLLKDIKSEEKEMIKIKQEGQKPTMETQGPPPPPTSQYYIHPSYMGPGPFGFDGGHPMYRNMIVPGAPYNPSPYHLQMARFHAPEDLSRNPNTKALDLLQHHASQYYQSHKIHELSERALKSPNSNPKVSVSSPNVPQPNSGSTQGGIIPPTNTGSSSLNLQPPPTSMPPGSGGISLGSQKNSEKPGSEPSIKDGPGGRSPPPQRHVHTHHHTHVGLGYPMYPAPYGAAAVLASQQAAAVVINPFPPGPTK